MIQRSLDSYRSSFKLCILPSLGRSWLGWQGIVELGSVKIEEVKPHPSNLSSPTITLANGDTLDLQSLYVSNSPPISQPRTLTFEAHVLPAAAFKLSRRKLFGVLACLLWLPRPRVEYERGMWADIRPIGMSDSGKAWKHDLLVLPKLRTGEWSCVVLGMNEHRVWLLIVRWEDEVAHRMGFMKIEKEVPGEGTITAKRKICLK